MRVLTGILLLSLLIAAPASACDLKNIVFGDTIDQTVSKYKLEVMRDANTDGEVVLAERGKVVCKALPEQSMIEFVFINNTLVKVQIENPNIAEELLKYAKNTFGQNDDVDRKKTRHRTTSLAVWGNDTNKAVMYSTHGTAHHGNFESLTIVSRQHNDLFETFAMQQGRAVDDALRQQGLGKYSPDYKQNTIGEGVNHKDKGVSEGAYDPNALDKLKESYDKQHKEWQEKNKAN